MFFLTVPIGGIIVASIGLEKFSYLCPSTKGRNAPPLYLREDFPHTIRTGLLVVLRNRTLKPLIRSWPFCPDPFPFPGLSPGPFPYPGPAFSQAVCTDIVTSPVFLWDSPNAMNPVGRICSEKIVHDAINMLKMMLTRRKNFFNFYSIRY